MKINNEGRSKFKTKKHHGKKTETEKIQNDPKEIEKDYSK